MQQNIRGIKQYSISSRMGFDKFNGMYKVSCDTFPGIENS